MDNFIVVSSSHSGKVHPHSSVKGFSLNIFTIYDVLKDLYKKALNCYCFNSEKIKVLLLLRCLILLCPTLIRLEK